MKLLLYQKKSKFCNKSHQEHWGRHWRQQEERYYCCWRCNSTLLRPGRRGDTGTWTWTPPVMEEWWTWWPGLLEMRILDTGSSSVSLSTPRSHWCSRSRVVRVDLELKTCISDNSLWKLTQTRHSQHPSHKYWKISKILGGSPNSVCLKKKLQSTLRLALYMVCDIKLKSLLKDDWKYLTKRYVSSYWLCKIKRLGSRPLFCLTGVT